MSNYDSLIENQLLFFHLLYFPNDHDLQFENINSLAFLSFKEETRIVKNINSPKKKCSPIESLTADGLDKQVRLVSDDNYMIIFLKFNAL